MRISKFRFPEKLKKIVIFSCTIQKYVLPLQSQNAKVAQLPKIDHEMLYQLGENTQ
jgi:hypothetical protein